MMENGIDRLCCVKSLRELRRVRKANEEARSVARLRIKSGVASVFSVNALLLALVEGCVPRSIKDSVTRLFSGFKE